MVLCMPRDNGLRNPSHLRPKECSLIYATSSGSPGSTPRHMPRYVRAFNVPDGGRSIISAQRHYHGLSSASSMLGGYIELQRGGRQMEESRDHMLPRISTVPTNEGRQLEIKDIKFSFRLLIYESRH